MRQKTTKKAEMPHISTLDKSYFRGTNAVNNLSLQNVTTDGDNGSSPRLDFGNKLYEDPYKKIYEIKAQFGSFEKKYYVSDSGCRSGVVLIKDDSILLVRQYRLLIDGMSWEIPGGGVDAGETPKDSAIRECREETGILCKSLHSLIAYHPGLDTFCNPTYIYYCEDFEEDNMAYKQNGETIENRWLYLNDVLEMIYSMQIVDAFTIIGIFSCLHKRSL